MERKGDHPGADVARVSSYIFLVTFAVLLIFGLAAVLPIARCIKAFLFSIAPPDVMRGLDPRTHLYPCIDFFEDGLPRHRRAKWGNEAASLSECLCPAIPPDGVR
jgi:hypothetical protein